MLLNKKASKDLIGKRVIVEQVGEPPCEAIVTAIDEVSGLITRVKMTGADGFEKIVDVSNTVVRLVSPIREIWLWVKGWFRRK
ncbi:MAG: hypothetical protein ACK4Q5_06030 [Saprospiraceae bacterium]